MTLAILLYIDAFLLNHYGIIHLKWWAWLLPVWSVIGRGISVGLVAFSNKFPLLSLPLFLLWIYAVLKFIFSLGFS